MLDHEQVVIRTGRRAGLPVIVAVHSTALGPAAGGLRFRRYAGWREALDDALRLSAAMTAKTALAGLPSGGGKTVVALPDGPVPDGARRRDVLHDVAEVVDSLDGAYATGPDVGTSPADMAVVGEVTPHVFCRPARLGGSGDSSPHTADGALAALRAAARHLYGTASLDGRRCALVGLGRVGERLGRLLAAEGAEVTATDIDPGKRDVCDALGAAWCDPAEIVAADADFLVPAALGGLLTGEAVGRLRCRAVVGPANDQLAEPGVADLLHRRAIPLGARPGRERGRRDQRDHDRAAPPRRRRGPRAGRGHRGHRRAPPRRRRPPRPHARAGGGRHGPRARRGAVGPGPDGLRAH